MWLPELQKKSSSVARICGPHYISAGPCWWYHCFRAHRTGLDSCLSLTNWWADLGLTSDHWNVKPLLLHSIKLPSWHQRETASQVASLRYDSRRQNRDSHTNPHPIYVMLKSFTFPDPFCTISASTPRQPSQKAASEQNITFTLPNLTKLPRPLRICLKYLFGDRRGKRLLKACFNSVWNQLTNIYTGQLSAKMK